MPIAGWRSRCAEVGIRRHEMHCQHVAPGFADCRVADGEHLCRLPRFGRRAMRSDDSQRFGRHIAGDHRARTAAESLAGDRTSQGSFSQVAQNCHRSDADSLPRPAVSGREGDLSKQTEERHVAFSRLCDRGRGSQGASIHAGSDPRRVWREDEIRGAAAAGDRAAAPGESPFSPAGQGVFQRRGDLVPETREGRLHHPGHGARTQTEGPQEGHRTAGAAEKEERLLQAHAHR